MTDAVLRGRSGGSYPSVVNVAAYTIAAQGGAFALLQGETSGFAIDATTDGGTVAGKISGAGVDNVPINESTYDPVVVGSNLITGSGQSPKWVKRADGTLRTASHNLFARSQAFDDAVWTKQNASVSANSTVAPDGTTTADSLIESSATNTHRMSAFGITAVVGFTYNFSIYAKAVTSGRSFNFVGFGMDAASEDPNFNVDAGTVDTGATTTIVQSATITSVGNGWYRCSAVITSNGTSNPEIYLSNSTTNNNVANYTGDGTSGIFFWGAQLTYGPTLHPYLSTAGAERYAVPQGYDTALSRYGILSEETATNILLQSENFGTTWTNGNSSETLNATLDPTGVTSKADKVIEALDVAQIHGWLQTAATSVTSGTFYTFSCFLKAAERNWVQLSGGTARFADQFNVFFDLTNGVVGTVGAGATSQGIEAFANGWYRCWMTAVADSTGAANFQIILGDADNSITYNGDGSSGAYGWGAQLEAGLYPSSYIPTATATVARAEDEIFILTSNVPSFVDFPGTLYIDFKKPVTPAGATNLWAIFLSANETISQDITAAVTTATLIDSGVVQVSSALGSITANARSQSTSAWDTNDFAGSLDGAASVVDTSCTMPSGLTHMYVGKTGAGPPLGGYIYRLIYVPYQRETVNGDVESWRFNF